MVALVVGLLIVAAMSMLFAGSSRSRREVELSADVIENGRYALDVLNRELSQTGFYGSLVTPVAAATAIDTPTKVATAMCLTTVANIAAWQDSLSYYAMGLRSASGANVDADPTCVARKVGTDALFVQRANTCAIGDADCQAESNSSAYLQVSECGTEYSTAATRIVVARGTSSAFTLQTKACDGATRAPKRKLVRRIYFVSAANELSYQELPISGSLPAAVVLVEGIEQMQIEYAVDSTGDGTPDTFEASPSDWTQVIGARVWLLARSSDISRNTKDAASFVLGADTTVSVAASASGNLKRRAYSTYVPFVTPKARRES
ncbi:hypothetical protein ASC76_07520 [Rhizobacter sp. Root404]|nr:hypothetical protein ASC76_07520 [Rhizobacter sp. Root404]